MQDVLRETGFDTRLEPTCTGIPSLMAELKSPGAERTLLIYNHYDVQPPEPLDLWTRPAFFEPTVRNGRLYAAGHDNKGNIASRIAAIKAILAERGSLPGQDQAYIIEGGGRRSAAPAWRISCRAARNC